jgi:hypothetical protein
MTSVRRAAQKKWEDLSISGSQTPLSIGGCAFVAALFEEGRPTPPHGPGAFAAS